MADNRTGDGRTIRIEKYAGDRDHHFLPAAIES